MTHLQESTAVEVWRIKWPHSPLVERVIVFKGELFHFTSECWMLPMAGSTLAELVELVEYRQGQIKSRHAFSGQGAA